MKNSKVNANVARDLISNASSKIDNITDFKDTHYHKAKRNAKK